MRSASPCGRWLGVLVGREQGARRGQRVIPARADRHDGPVPGLFGLEHIACARRQGARGADQRPRTRGREHRADAESFCHQVGNYITQVKLMGTYRIPNIDVQFAFVDSRVCRARWSWPTTRRPTRWYSRPWAGRCPEARPTSW